MRKGLKIFLGILGGIAAAALLFWLIFPGLPAYWAANRLFSYKDTVLGDYPYAELGTPADYKPLTDFGLQIMVPQSVEKIEKASSIPVYTNRDTKPEGEALLAVAFIDHSAASDMEMIGEEGFTQAQFDRGMRGIRREKPANNFECWDMLYNLTPADYNYHKHGTWTFYLQLMRMKDELYPSVGQVGYHFENDTAKGFVFEYGKPDANNDKYALLIELYGKDDPDRCHGVIIKSADYDMIKQIANSAQVVPE